jgi:poly-gamma-glutamate capsule biosynthesis protein CapA/YwtB (metallophosphatase superfamily)
MMINSDIKILITGDLCPVNRIENLVLMNDFGSIFNDFIDEFRGNDLNITDLECPLTVSESARPKTGPHQKAHPDCIRILKYADIGLAAMANNHIMDYDNRGVKDTLELCKVNLIDTVGIGKTVEDAAKPYTGNIKGKRIGILNYADNEFLSTPDGSFNCNPVNSVQFYYDIKKIRQYHDYLIIILHAGNEFYNLPSPRTKKLSEYLIDNGADVVISHHTHAFSGYEIYRSKPIFYGLGNFIYDWPGKINSGWNKGYVVRLQISEKINFEIIPLKQCNEKAGVFHLDPEERKVFNKELERLNQIITDDERLETEFQEYCKSVYPMYDAFIEPYFGKYITALRKRGFFPKLMSRRKRLLLLNLTRCESHREVLLRMLKRYE